MINPIYNQDSREGTIDRQSKIEALDKEGKRIKLLVICPNCKKVIKAIAINSDEPKIFQNVKCKNCPIAGFDWEYKPMQVGDRYVFINSSASVSAGQMPKMIIHNDRHINISNR